VNNNNQLVVSNLTHSFINEFVLRDINISLAKGQVMAIVGRSGCGKSTLLNCIAQLIEADEGTIVNPFSTTSILFQEPRLLPWLTARDNIGWGMKAKKIAKKQRQPKIRQLAIEVGLSESDLEKYPHELSGGMRQRVAMARSFAIEPDLLLLDEPFSALDIGLKEGLHALLMSEIERRDLTVLFITHDLMEAVKLADQIVVLSESPGRQVYTQRLCQPRPSRHQDYLYATTMDLLKVGVVQQAFQTGVFSA
jgi:NitT/TauT family transport system ATP-binding protein